MQPFHARILDGWKYEQFIDVFRSGWLSTGFFPLPPMKQTRSIRCL